MHRRIATKLALASFAIALALNDAGPAAAQAFTQPQGHGRVIVSTLGSGSDRAFDDAGNAADISHYDQLQVYVLGEYGVTHDLTLLLTPSYRSVSVRGQPDSDGLGYTDVGARYRIAHDSRFVVSVQGLVRIPGQTRRDVLAQIGQIDAEYDLRAQGAFTFGGGSFVIAEGAYRLRAGDPPDDVHLDATLGIRAAPRLLLLANSYNTISNGSGRGVFRRYRYHNAYASAAYDVSRSLTLQFGGYGTLAGRNALRERGLFGGVWFRF